MERLTRFVLRHRFPVLAAWAVALVACAYGASQLASLQSNVFSVPGSDSERVRLILQREFGDRSDGGFTAVFRVSDSSDSALRARLQRAVERAARVVPSGRATPLVAAGRFVLYADVTSTRRRATRGPFSALSAGPRAPRRT